MKTVRMRIDPEAPASLNPGRIDSERVDATTEPEIARQVDVDEAEAMQNSAYRASHPSAFGVESGKLVKGIDVILNATW